MLHSVSATVLSWYAEVVGIALAAPAVVRLGDEVQLRLPGGVALRFRPEEEEEDDACVASARGLDPCGEPGAWRRLATLRGTAAVRDFLCARPWAAPQVG